MNYSEQIISELYRAYDFINQEICENILPKPIILIQSGGSKSACGWFAPNNWSKQSEQIHELTIHQESFVHGFNEVFDTLLHEMAHIYNFVMHGKIVDCTKQQRHNKIFKRAAEKFTLSVGSCTRLGFAHTSLTEESHKLIDRLNPDMDIYTIAQGMGAKAMEDKKNKKKNKKAKRKSLVVASETKDAVESAAEQYNVSQKEIADKAIAFYLHCLEQGIEIPQQFQINQK